VSTVDEHVSCGHTQGLLLGLLLNKRVHQRIVKGILEYARDAPEENGWMSSDLTKIKTAPAILFQVDFFVRRKRPDGSRPYLVEAALSLRVEGKGCAQASRG
jgi:hypothetical protein